MKAKRVYESVDFQRGGDPKDAIFGAERQRKIMERAINDFGKKYNAGYIQTYGDNVDDEFEIVSLAGDIPKYPDVTFIIRYFPNGVETYPFNKFPLRSYIGELYPYKVRASRIPETEIMASKNINEIIEFFEREMLNYML